VVVLPAEAVGHQEEGQHQVEAVLQVVGVLQVAVELDEVVEEQVEFNQTNLRLLSRKR
jgi:hypothetical protein